jgi:tetratricopeptide (TPR) repeat protein
MASRPRRPRHHPRRSSTVALAGAVAVLVAAGIFLPAADLAAQHGNHVEPAGDEVPLYTGIGSLSRSITTVSPLAQAYFDQGLRLTYGFGHGEGIRSFREAQAHDPTCASCFWGEAWALGPHINGAMRNDAVPAAWAALRRAMELADGASDVEQALIGALAVRYAQTPDATPRAVLDSAYARAMEEVAARFPRDLEVLTLLGEAHMVLRPWNYWADDGSPQPGADRAVEVLEQALAVDLGHPGACHLYIHLVEASPDPARAAPCAELLEDAIPGVSHIPHMPSHIFMRIGRYGDAVRGNQRAWVADQRAADDGPPGVYTSHNLHMLAFAASFDGQSAVAMQAARNLAEIAAGSSFYVPLTLVRFGRWDEILAGNVVEAEDIREGVHHFARGLARLRLGSPMRAELELAALDRIREELPDDLRFRGHLQRDLLGIARGILAGEILAARGEVDAAVAALEEALALELGLAYDEPEPWTIPVRHFLGAVLLEADRPADAEAVHRASLDVHPDNGWALLGLASALRAQGNEIEADRVEADGRRAFERTDVWIAGSRF